MATPTANHTATAARLAQAQSLHRKALAELGKALATYRNAGPEAKGVVELLQRAHDVGTAVLAQLGVDLAKAQAEAEQPAPKPVPAPKVEQPKPAPAPAITLPEGWEDLPTAAIGALFGALGGVAPKGGLDRVGTIAAVRELVAKNAAAPAPAAKPETPKAAAHTAAETEQPARKADPKPAAKPETPKADPLAEYRALVAECKAYGLNAKGKADELRARLAEAKAKGATKAAGQAAKAAIPSDAELARLDSKALVALFRKLPVELQRELLAAAR